MRDKIAEPLGMKVAISFFLYLKAYTSRATSLKCADIVNVLERWSKFYIDRRKLSLGYSYYVYETNLQKIYFVNNFSSTSSNQRNIW